MKDATRRHWAAAKGTTKLNSTNTDGQCATRDDRLGGACAGLLSKLAEGQNPAASDRMKDAKERKQEKRFPNT